MPRGFPESSSTMIVDLQAAINNILDLLEQTPGIASRVFLGGEIQNDQHKYCCRKSTTWIRNRKL